jgi:hypothetical protein
LKCHPDPFGSLGTDSAKDPYDEALEIVELQGFFAYAEPQVLR